MIAYSIFAGNCFLIPDGVEGQLTMEVTMWYRLALQEIVKQNLKLNVIVPPIMMEQVTVDVEVEK